MSSQHAKQVNAQVKAATLRTPVRPSRIGYWVCPSCNTINQADVTVVRADDQAYYAVPDRVTCKGSSCGHTFETLPPTPAHLLIPQAT